MTHSGCSCKHCNGNCHKRPSDEQVEKDIVHMIAVRDVVRAIGEIDRSIAEWAFLGNYLVINGVFI